MEGELKGHFEFPQIFKKLPKKFPAYTKANVYHIYLINQSVRPSVSQSNFKFGVDPNVRPPCAVCPTGETI